MADEAHEEVEALLAEMERKIRREYTRAAVELQEKRERYMEEYEGERVKMMARVEAGEITERQFRRWARDYAIGSQWYDSMIETLAQDLVEADRKAASVVNGYTPEAYAVNHNFGTYQIEKAGMVDTSFTLYDRQTVERLLREDPELVPRAEIDAKKDLRWNRQKVSSAVLQSILQGEGQDRVAERLASVVGMDMRSAMRVGRTVMTGAQNAGRVDSYRRAADMGIELRQEWLATLDMRTRHSHRRLDGERVAVGEEFSNGCRYPGDPEGEAGEVYNCRCTLVPVVEGVDQSDAPRNSRIGKMSYEEWRNEHEAATEEPGRIRYGKFRDLSFMGDRLGRHVGDGSEMDPLVMIREDTGFDEKRSRQVVDDIDKWTTTHYGQIRSHADGTEDIRNRIEEFLEASPKYKGTVWRGVGLGRAEADRVLDALRSGERIDQQGMASWTTGIDWATEFANVNTMFRDDGVAVVFRLDENKSGVSINHIATIDNDEVLSPEGVEYVLSGDIEWVDGTNGTGYWLVPVEEA